MAKGLGKFLTGVAEVAQPMALERQRAEILRARDERLQQFQQQERKAGQEFHVQERIAGQEFQVGERQAGQEFSREQAGLDRDLTERQVEIGERGLELEGQRLDLSKRQADAAINAHEKEIEKAGLQIAELQDYKQARQALKNATDENRDELYRDYLMITGKYTSPDRDNLSIQKVKRFDDLGNEVGEDLLIVDPSTGQGRRVEIQEGFPAPDPEDVQMLQGDPSAAAKAEFDEMFGAGMAAKILGQGTQESAPATAQETAAEPSVNQLITEVDQVSNQAFRRPDQRPPGLIERVGNFLSEAPARGAARSERERERRASMGGKARGVNMVMAQLREGYLPTKDTDQQKRWIQYAIESGRLSEQEVAALERWLEED